MATNKYENLQFIKKETLEGMADAIRDKMPDKGNITATQMVEAVEEYTTDATATGNEMLAGATAYAKNKKITGTIPTVSIPKPGIALNESNGVITATETLNTTGYYEAGNNSSTQQLPTQGNISIHPGHDPQTITEYTKKYLTGNLLVDGSDDLHSENILANKTIFGVPGSHVCDQLPAGEVDRSITYDGKGTDIKANIKVVTQNGSAANMVGVATGDVSITKKASDLDSDLKAENIKMDEEIFGVHGTFTEVTNGTAVSASDIRKNKTAFVNGGQVNGTMPDTTLTASGTASATTTVAPGDITISNKTDDVSGKKRLTASPTTDTNQIDTYYMAVGATAEANSTGTTSDISGEATASIDAAGYVSSGAKGNVTGTATAKTSKKSSATYYIPVASGECTVLDGRLSVTESYSGTPTVDITLDAQTTSGVAITDSKPSSGYYLTVGASSSKLTGSTEVTRADVKIVQSHGYIPYKASETVIASDSASPTVTVNKGTKTEYITIPTASGSIGGSASSGKATANINNVHNMNTVESPTGAAGTDYFTVKATATGTAGGYTPKYTVTKEGYIGSTVEGTQKTVSVSNDNTGKSIHIPKASLSAYGSCTNAKATVEPGELTVENFVAVDAQGKTQIHVSPTDWEGIDTPYYVAVRPHVAAGSGTISGDGTSEASVNSAGYAPGNLSSSGYVSVSGTATSSEKSGSVHYFPIQAVSTNGVEVTEKNGKAIAEVNVIADGYAQQGLLASTELPELEVEPYNDAFSDTYHYSYNNGSSYINIYKQLAKGGWAYKSNFFGYDSINVAALSADSTGLKAENIKAGESIFGVSGTYAGIESNWSSIDVKVGQYAYGCVTGMLGGTYSISSDCAYYFPDTSSGIDGQFLLSGNRVGSCVLAVLALRTNGSWGVDCFTIHVTE